MGVNSRTHTVRSKHAGTRCRTAQEVACRSLVCEWKKWFSLRHVRTSAAVTVRDICWSPHGLVVGCTLSRGLLRCRLVYAQWMRMRSILLGICLRA